MLAEEAPKITDWMQAWGSVVGLVMSTAAVIFTGLLFRHEIRVRRDESRDAEAAQARLIVGEIMYPFGPAGQYDGVSWVVHNHSSAPIFSLYVAVSSSSLDGLLLYRGNPDDYPDAVAPGGSVSGSWTFDEPIPEHSWVPDGGRVMLEFVDASGLTWQRAGSMSPKRRVNPSMPHASFWPLFWEFAWPLSVPWHRLRGIRARLRRRVLKYMRARVMRRRQRVPTPTTARRLADRAAGHGADRAAG